MKAVVKQIEGCSFIGKAESNHWVPVDSKKEFAGSDAATHPMELVLLALGSCTGCDVASILEKKKVQLKGFEIHIDAQRAEIHPKVFTSIHLEFVFFGTGLNPTHLQRAIELSQQKYCSVSAMLKASVPITTSYRIVEEKQEDRP
ncbi:MAG TPA: osmotically inducible protein OsmC [Thermoplasmata archaeon]|jgi:putative redox protein|nr:MAG TPA: osmotically inducible protein OsmC [Thermoplasmata archaeon]